MEQAPLQIAQELQLNQLPEGTEIQVRPVPLSFAYKRLGGEWIPIESDPTVYEPVIGDDFPLGSIAIDPEGIGYETSLLARAGRVRAPHPLPNDAAAAPSGANEDDIAMGVVVPAHDFQADFPYPKPGFQNLDDGLDGHHSGPSLPAPGDYASGQSMRNGSFGHYEVSGVDGPRFAAPAGSEEVHHMFNELQMADEEEIQPPSQFAPAGNHVVDNELQEVRHANLGCTIYFDQQGNGIPLTAVNTLDEELLAFEQDVSLGIKASIRFKFKYWQSIPDLREHVDRRKQVNIRHGSKDGTPISLRVMARLVLSELQAEMKTMADLNYPLRHGGVPVRVEELVLVRIERIKFGTLQPVFMLRR
ncbi:hypothetical protein LXA43DRAFT_1121500 [Ganoderma leucocontextum]|nr:hypothetical protein LXA43DRAFT_1121500 [Ganoderma leucocontextum]